MSSDPSARPDVPGAVPAEVPVRVRLMGRDFTLRSRDETRMRASAAYVEGKLAAFRKAHPMQNETTAALIVALAIGDELLDARRRDDAARDDDAHVTDALLALDLHLATALLPRRAPRPTPAPDAGADEDDDDMDDDENDADGDESDDDDMDRDENDADEETPDGTTDDVA